MGEVDRSPGGLFGSSAAGPTPMQGLGGWGSTNPRFDMVSPTPLGGHGGRQTRILECPWLSTSSAHPVSRLEKEEPDMLM